MTQARAATKETTVPSTAIFVTRALDRPKLFSPSVKRRDLGSRLIDCGLIICKRPSITGLNNVCAFARSPGSRCRLRPGHHKKPRKNGGVFESFVWCPVYGEKVEPDRK